MSVRYSVIREYTQDRDSNDSVPDVIQSSPKALVVVWPFAYRQTFSRKLGTSYSTNLKEAVETGGPVFLYSAIKNLVVNHSKDSYLGRASFSLRPDQAWMDVIYPGDHCAAWICHSESEILKIIKQVKSGKPANFWWSGLKFYGRVDDVSEDINNSPNGLRSAHYSVTATSFRELASTIYFNPRLAPQQTSINELFERLGIPLDNLITGSGDRAGIETHVALPILLDLITIDGVSDNLQKFADVPELKFIYGNKAFLVPNSVADIFGVKGAASDTIPRYGNIIKLLYGVQKYYYKNPDAPGPLFEPAGVVEKQGRIDTKTPLLGKMTAAPPDLFNRPVFQVLHDYLNPGCNEMFTTLRSDGGGNIYPTIVARQFPFSTAVSSLEQAIDRTTKVKDLKPQFDRIREEVEQEFGSGPEYQSAREAEYLNRRQVEIERVFGGKFKDRFPALTYFRELPRWVIHPMMVKGTFSVSRTDAARVNYVQWTGQVTDGNKAVDWLLESDQLVNAPPPTDMLDVYRSGLYANIASIPASSADVAFAGPAIWQAIAADMYMGAHLLLRGNLNTVGIQAPIAVGDNVEIGTRLFHLNGIAHNFISAPDGNTSFVTTLSLVRGVDATTADTDNDEELGWAFDNRENQPGITVDGKLKRG